MIITSIDQLLSGRPLISVAPETSVEEACSLMARRNVGAVAVLRDGRLAGIVCERDVLRRCISAGRPVAETPVAEIMTTEPVTVRRRESLADAQTKMSEGGFRHLPVVTGDGRPVGIVSMRDIPTEYRLMVERFRDSRRSVLAG
ncbi:CBS domain-containing protein [Salipiger sp. P9]|uniref:CBS domain-containing protein n=1 Tax=Salipiger pentaromativorans TaxID=2943193 RepID=UPI0021589A2D|nr:CBS domain-containing protein [Salipiger pentaromativorans]MCR8549345.1 CBS domain-containing protein [Salipiger pentaromativorans]